MWVEVGIVLAFGGGKLTGVMRELPGMLDVFDILIWIWLHEYVYM